jgi:hypothetical protein
LNREKFKVYAKAVEVETKNGKEVYELLPLSGRYLPKLMGVVKELSKNSEDKAAAAEELMKEETIIKVHELLMETFKFSYKITDARDIEDLDLFVSQNLFALVPALINVNLGSNVAEEKLTE